MIIEGIDKPVYALNRNFKKGITKKLSDIFTNSKGNQTIIKFDTVENIRKELFKRQITELRDDLSYFRINIDRDRNYFLEHSTKLNFVTLKEAGCYIVNSQFKNCLQNYYTDFAYVETEDAIYDITNSNYVMGVSPKSCVELLKKHGLFDSSAKYHRIPHNNVCRYDSIGNELFMKEVYFSDKPFIFIEDAFRDLSKHGSILTKEELKTVMEMLTSPDENTVKLGVMLLGTSDYMKLYYTSRAIIFRRYNYIMSKMSRDLNKTIPGFIDNVMRFRTYYEDRPLKLTDLQLIFDAKPEFTEEDQAMFKDLFRGELDDSINKLVSKKTKNALSFLGYNFEAKLIEK